MTVLHPNGTESRLTNFIRRLIGLRREKYHTHNNLRRLQHSTKSTRGHRLTTNIGRLFRSRLLVSVLHRNLRRSRRQTSRTRHRGQRRGHNMAQALFRRVRMSNRRYHRQRRTKHSKIRGLLCRRFETFRYTGFWE